MRPISRAAALMLILTLASGSVASAQSTPAGNSDNNHTALWTIVGAGAGFGLGIYIGLNAFDDAVDSDRKVWTTAFLSAAAGGVLGYLISRGRSKSTARPDLAPPAASPGRAGQPLRFDASAPALGSGAFRGWLEHSILQPVGP